MLVSFIVVALNAGNKLNSLINELQKQDYEHKNIEIIFVDSDSNDNTKEIMFKLANSNHDFSRVCVLNNPKKILPCGWNIALKESKGDIILRVDAHSSIPKDFVRRNVECITGGQKICGGRVKSIIEDNSKLARVLLLAENSAFGGGIAAFRRKQTDGYVKTLAFAAYSKEVFEVVGKYDERLARTEDNEMHYRMKKAGYKFYYNSKIYSTRYSRNSIYKMMKQKFLNGYWIGLTMAIAPKAFELYHFTPFIFLLSLMVSLFVMIFGKSMFFLLISGFYLFGTIIMSLFSSTQEKDNVLVIFLPLLLFLIHISYGVGTLVGVIKMPFWKKTIKLQ